MVRLTLDLPALERLIGGDSDVEVELRQGVVTSFAKRHLKEVINSGVLEPYFRNISQALTEELKALIPLEQKKIQKEGRWGSSYGWRLVPGNPWNDKVIEAVKAHAKASIKELVDESFTAAWEETKVACLERIDRNHKTLLKLVSKEVEKQVSSRFQAEVKAEVDRRIKAAAAAVEGP